MDLSNMHNSQTTDNSAGAKRKRLTQACDVCRRKKIKCDGAKPACANCVRMKQECSYLPSNKKRGPRQGYIELLEKRLDKMEKMLQNNPEDASPEEISPTDFDAPLFQHSKNHRQFSTDSEDQAKPLVNGRTQGSSDQSPAPSPTSPSSRLSQFSPIMSHSSNSLTSRSNTEDGVLPSADVIEHLVAVYFEHLYPMMPVLHPKFFMEKIRNKKCPEVLLLSVMALSARFSTRSDILENPPWLSGEKYASRARKIINNIFDYPSFSSAQALLLLGIYEFGCSRGPRSWMLLGMALRMCTELGMHKESLHESDFAAPLSEDEWVDKESRRRLFWQIYIVDILACANSGRPRSIGELDCQLLLPSDDGCWSNSLLYTETLDGTSSVRFKQTGEGNIIGALFNNGKLPATAQSSDMRSRCTLSLTAYLARAATILSRITSYINRSKIRDLNHLSDKNSELLELDDALTTLQTNLPEFFQFTLENIEDFRHGTPAEFHSLVMLHGLINTGMLLLHRPSLLLSGAAESAIVQPWIRQQIDHAKLKCNQATDRITHILNLCVSGDPKVMVPLLCYSAYITCTVLVNIAFQDDQVEAEKARKSLAICFRYLLTIRPFWSMADRYYFMARDLYGLRSKINGKGKMKFGVCPMAASQDEMMRTAKNDLTSTTEPAGGKPFMLPVQTDSGFVALWQMATLQQAAQDHMKRKETSDGPQDDMAVNDATSVQPIQSNDDNPLNSYANSMVPPNGNTTQTNTMAHNMAAPMKFMDDNVDDQVSVAAVTEFYSSRMASNPSTFADTGLNIPGNDPTGFNFLFDGSLLNDMMFPVMWPGMEDNVMADIRLNTPNWTLDNSNLLSMPDERPFNVQQAAPVQNTFDKMLTAATRDPGNGSHSLNTPP
ncbi:unnamed protein product [Umbelopsis ramanniana]